MASKKKNRSTEETENNVKHIESEAEKEIDTLDSLAFDSEDDSISESDGDDQAKFAAFMAEYRTLMNKNLSSSENTEAHEEEDESEFLITPPKKQSKKKKSNSFEVTPIDPPKEKVWDEGITLSPEKFDDPAEEDKIMYDQLPEEEVEPDFNLGEKPVERDDKNQISIDFENGTASEDEEVIEEPKGYDPEKPRLIDWIFDLVEMFVFVLLTVMILTSFVFKHSVVEGDSMLNTLHDGEHLIISNLFYTPERGDIVVFEDYSTSLKKAVVKRVIGLPGETIEVKINTNGVYEVYVDGVFLAEDYAYNEIEFTTPAIGVWTVGEGEIFVMGDNRYNSTDSRDSRVGTVKIETVLGKVLFRFYPFDKFGGVD